MDNKKISRVVQGKPIVYVDMDGVIADYEGRARELGYDLDDASKHTGFFASLAPIEGAVDALEELATKYDVYILSAASWTNPVSFSEKIDWIKKYMPKFLKKKVIFSHDKSLLKGSYLIDDRDTNRQSEFEGEWLLFGGERFPDWRSVLDYLM